MNQLILTILLRPHRLSYYSLTGSYSIKTSIGFRLVRRFDGSAYEDDHESSVVSSSDLFSSSDMDVTAISDMKSPVSVFCMLLSQIKRHLSKQTNTEDNSPAFHTLFIVPFEPSLYVSKLLYFASTCVGLELIGIARLPLVSTWICDNSLVLPKPGRVIFFDFQHDFSVITLCKYKLTQNDEKSIVEVVKSHQSQDLNLNSFTIVLVTNCIDWFYEHCHLEISNPELQQNLETQCGHALQRLVTSSSTNISICHDSKVYNRQLELTVVNDIFQKSPLMNEVKALCRIVTDECYHFDPKMLFIIFSDNFYILPCVRNLIFEIFHVKTSTSSMTYLNPTPDKFDSADIPIGLLEPADDSQDDVSKDDIEKFTSIDYQLSVIESNLIIANDLIDSSLSDLLTRPEVKKLQKWQEFNFISQSNSLTSNSNQLQKDIESARCLKDLFEKFKNIDNPQRICTNVSKFSSNLFFEFSETLEFTSFQDNYLVFEKSLLDETAQNLHSLLDQLEESHSNVDELISLLNELIVVGDFGSVDALLSRFSKNQNFFTF
ncbi:hypothetical protein GEMRC1_006721 [Eukaryota sp. GEM-RC1]